MRIASFRCHSCHLCQIQPNSFFYSINVIQLFNLKKMCYKLVKINDPSTMVLRCHCPASFFCFSPGFVLILLSVLFNSLHHFFFISIQHLFTFIQHFLLFLKLLFYFFSTFFTSSQKFIFLPFTIFPLPFNIMFPSLHCIIYVSAAFVLFHITISFYFPSVNFYVPAPFFLLSFSLFKLVN